MSINHMLKQCKIMLWQDSSPNCSAEHVPLWHAKTSTSMYVHNPPTTATSCPHPIQGLAIIGRYRNMGHTSSWNQTRKQGRPTNMGSCKYTNLKPIATRRIWCNIQSIHKQQQNTLCGLFIRRWHGFNTNQPNHHHLRNWHITVNASSPQFMEPGLKHNWWCISPRKILLVLHWFQMEKWTMELYTYANTNQTPVNGRPQPTGDPSQGYPCQKLEEH